MPIMPTKTRKKAAPKPPPEEVDEMTLELLAEVAEDSDGEIVWDNTDASRDENGYTDLDYAESQGLVEAEIQSTSEDGSLSAKEVARACGTDARTFRKFLRDTRDGGKAIVGQGGRYSFSTEEVGELKTAFLSWGKGGTKEKTPKVKKPAAPPVETDDDEFEEVFDLDEPDDEDIEELEIEEDEN